MADKRLSTPLGTAVYPRLKTPDTKFDELGIYKADVAVPLAAAEELIAELTAIFKKHTGKAPKRTDNPMFAFEVDSEGEETGNVIFKCRVKNKMNSRTGELWDRRPKQFDAGLKPIDTNPWGGTKMIVSFDVHEWEYGGKSGVSLQPIGVQIIDLKTGTGGADPSAMGFAQQEGYTAPDAAAEAGLRDSENPADGMDDEADNSVADGSDY